MSGDGDYNSKEKIVQTEQRFSIDVKHTRGTDVRDEDTVSVSWSMERRPTQGALTDLVHDVKATMEHLRPGDDSDD